MMKPVEQFGCGVGVMLGSEQPVWIEHAIQDNQLITPGSYASIHMPVKNQPFGSRTLPLEQQVLELFLMGSSLYLISHP